MKAMILAAGRGERMRPLTDSMPKPLLRVGGRPLIEYHIEALARAGVDEIVINLAWQGVQIRETLGDGSSYGLLISYSDEGAEALETGGGIRHALPLLGPAPFWLVNGDVYCEFDYPARVLDDAIMVHLLMVPNPEHHPAGDFGLEGGRVLPRRGAVEGSAGQSGGMQTWTYSGISLLRPSLFAGCRKARFPLAPLLIAAMKQDAVTGETFDGRWVDAGTPERLTALDDLLRSGQA